VSPLSFQLRTSWSFDGPADVEGDGEGEGDGDGEVV
jgi:hypothetical protein